jgi:hypothetical protein
VALILGCRLGRNPDRRTRNRCSWGQSPDIPIDDPRTAYVRFALFNYFVRRSAIEEQAWRA